MAIYSGFTHWKWWFSIVMLVYQRVSIAALMFKGQKSTAPLGEAALGGAPLPRWFFSWNSLEPDEFPRDFWKDFTMFIGVINHSQSWVVYDCFDHLKNIWLVVRAITILKNDGVKVNGKDDIPYMKWKIKLMFETTNQCMTLWKDFGIWHLVDHWRPTICPDFLETDQSEKSPNSQLRYPKWRVHFELKQY